jgi:hypothetical protein
MRHMTTKVMFSEEELAAIDRVRGDVPRERWIRRLCADAVAAHDAVMSPEESHGSGGGANAEGSVVRGSPRGATDVAAAVPGFMTARALVGDGKRKPLMSERLGGVEGGAVAGEGVG